MYLSHSQLAATIDHGDPERPDATNSLILDTPLMFPLSLLNSTEQFEESHRIKREVRMCGQFEIVSHKYSTSNEKRRFGVSDFNFQDYMNPDFLAQH